MGLLSALFQAVSISDNYLVPLLNNTFVPQRRVREYALKHFIAEFCYNAAVIIGNIDYEIEAIQGRDFVPSSWGEG